MRTATIRDVIYLDLLQTPEPPHAPHRTMSKFLDYVEHLYNIGETAHWTKGNRRKLFIRNFRRQNGNRAEVLLYYTDGEAAGASFAHLDHDTQRDEDKGEREGRPESAHVILSEQSSDAHQCRYLGLLEESSKINRRRLEMYLNSLFRKAFKHFRREFFASSPDGSVDENGNPNTYKFKPKFAIQGHMSQEFYEVLETGKLRGISLETGNVAITGSGESAQVRPIRKSLKLTSASSWREQPVTKLRDATSMGRRHQYERARVTFDAPDGTSSSINIDTETENPVGEGYLKRRRYTANSLLPEAHRDFDEDILAFMNQVLLEERGE